MVNENDAVALDEVLATRIGENDSLSAYVANLVDADLLVMLTDVTGLYDRDPHEDPAAQLIPRIDRIDAAIEAAAGGATGPGTGGMVTKLTAARVATQGGSDVIITSGREPDALIDAATVRRGGGTFFPAAEGKLKAASAGSWGA
ncbi:MAG: hypothetical protein U5Q44_04650 [Dehalococcoidia bacterium]|nr:hypothetical protein [Dehalococcoidia bacterium]